MNLIVRQHGANSWTQYVFFRLERGQVAHPSFFRDVWIIIWIWNLPSEYALSFFYFIFMFLWSNAWTSALKHISTTSRQGLIGELCVQRHQLTLMDVVFSPLPIVLIWYGHFSSSYHISSFSIFSPRESLASSVLGRYKMLPVNPRVRWHMITSFNLYPALCIHQVFAYH